MAKAGYDISTEANVGLVAATAKTVLGVLAPAQFGCDLRAIKVSFDGVTNTDKPVLCELVAATFATNPPGTNSTSATVQQVYGRAITAGFTGAYAWSTEPTVLSVLQTWLLTPNGGTYDADLPLAETFDNDVSKGFAIRLTAPTSAVNARGTFRVERC